MIEEIKKDAIELMLSMGISQPSVSFAARAFREWRFFFTGLTKDREGNTVNFFTTVDLKERSDKLENIMHPIQQAITKEANHSRLCGF
jgi:hypothetical protein